MRLLLLLLIVSPVVAFLPISFNQKKDAFIQRATALNVHRRDVIFVGTFGLSGIPNLVNAKSSTFFYDDKIELQPVEPSQMPTSGKLDLNSAFVGEYSQFPGMYPHAAGKIASNGPYRKVDDIYKITGLTSNDVQMFKKYQSKFTVNPPGRSFSERINSRVST